VGSEMCIRDSDRIAKGNTIVIEEEDLEMVE
jgi:hypothetical protein